MRYAALVSPPALGLSLQALVQVTLDDIRRSRGGLRSRDPGAP